MRAAFSAWIVLFGALLAAPAQAAPDAEYIAQVDRDRIALDETVTLTVTMATGESVEKLELPGTPDFDVVSQSRSQQMSFSFGGGSSGSRRTRVYTLVLRPRREGTLAILPGTAIVGGRRYLTAKLAVEVGPPGTGTGGPQARRGPAPGLPPSPFDDDPFFGSLLGGSERPAGEADLFLRAIVDKEEVHVGEQVTLSLYVFSRSEISQVEGLRLPKLDGFWSEELQTPRQIRSETRTIDGVPYRAYLIQRRALFPLEAGELEIGGAELDIVVGRFFGGGRKYHRASPGATIRAKPLPSGAPDGFRQGNVGRFELSLSAEPARVAVGEPVTVRIEATGAGNLANLELPPLPAIDGFRAFDPTHEQRARPEGGRWGGTKSAEWVLVAERPGAYRIPSLALVAFDPESGSYVTSRTEPVTLAVAAGAAAASPPSAQAPSDGLREVRLAEAERRRPFHESPLFVAALALPALAVLGVALGPRLRRAGGRAERKRRPAPDLDALRAQAAREDPAFFAACEALLLARASERIGAQATGLPREELSRRLERSGVAAGAVEALAEALSRCEAARWAPSALPPDALASTLRAAEAAIEGLS